MQIQVRQATQADAQEMFNLYNQFAQEFAGPTARNPKTYQHLLRKKEKINLVATDKQGKIVGYVSARFDKTRREGRIEEIVVGPNIDFGQVTKPLVEETCNALAKNKPAAVVATCFGNPLYDTVFPSLGFSTLESTGVFMYAVLNPQRFLNDLSPILASRLKRMKEWNGSIQIECEGHSLFLHKTNENVEPFFWTNQPIDFKAVSSRHTLTKLIFSVADPLECVNSDDVKVEGTVNREETNQLLQVLFPKREFFIIDCW